MLRTLALVLVVGVACLGGAATFTVNRTTDAVDTNPGDGYCGGPLGPCTLRAAIQEANAGPDADTIILPAGVYTLTIRGEDEDAAATGDLDILGDLTIIGAGAGVTIIDAHQIDRVLDLRTAGRPIEVSLTGISVTGGAALSASTYTGGGIRVGQDTLLRASDCRITANSANRGGGVFLDGLGATADIRYSTLDANSVADLGFSTMGGPAISDSDGGGERLALRSCTITGNSYDSLSGFAVSIDNASECMVADTTITENFSSGARSYNVATTIVHSTIVGNGNIGLDFSSSNSSHALTLTNTIIGGAFLACQINNPSVYTHAGNIDTTDSCGLDTSAGEMVWTDPDLGPLADNGGPTMTRLPNPGSPAIDAAADPPYCTSPDQRGVSRPQDGDGDGVAACDIGAVEAEAPLFFDDFESGDTSFWSAWTL